jgi:hypothetical protein
MMTTETRGVGGEEDRVIGMGGSSDDIGNARIEDALDFVLDQQLSLLEPGDFELIGAGLGGQRLEFRVQPAMLDPQLFAIGTRLIIVPDPPLPSSSVKSKSTVIATGGSARRVSRDKHQDKSAES